MFCDIGGVCEDNGVIVKMKRLGLIGEKQRSFHCCFNLDAREFGGSND